MTPNQPNYDDFGHYLYLDIDNHIVEYDNTNHPIYNRCYTYEQENNFITSDSLLTTTENKNDQTHTISTYATSGLFIISIALYLLF